MEFDPTKKPTYIFKYPFRFVKPYSHIFQTHAKKRWLGKNIFEVLTKQFQAYSEHYFKQAILAGKVTINGKKIALDYVIKNSDLLRHETIRQQPPILDLPIEIIHEDDDFLVVCKPPGMVVHTGGGYHYNSMMAILHYEMGYGNLYILHRLDRLTSGVVILAKKRQKTTKFHEESMEEVMKKSYYARVSGNVDFQQKIVDASMVCLSHKQGVWGVFNPDTMKDLLKTQQPKQSSTKFVKVWYDENTDSSLLQCYPVTGRTHQIRVHLAHINHPILNDVVYGGKFVGNWAIEKIEQLKKKVENDMQITDKVQKRIKESKQQKQEQQPKLQTDYDIDYQKWDYKTKPLEIFLHSFRYRFEQKQYTSRKPYWIEPDAIKFNKNINEYKEQRVRSKYESFFISQAISQRNKAEGQEEKLKIEKTENKQINQKAQTNKQKQEEIR